jgi:zeta-carotene desaturase
LAAASALSAEGLAVSLFERRPYLGGRASSYEHPGTGEVIDNCQHVLLGCCTNLIQLYERLGVEDKVRWFDRLTFLEPGGRASVIRPSFLPAPLHTLPAFVGASCLAWRDKLSIASAMAVLAPGTPPDTGEDFLAWLRRHHQTQTAIERFWKTVLVSALNEDLDRVSVPYAAQVVRESFLKSPQAGRMGVPLVPLTELYGGAAGHIRECGGEVKLRSPVEGFRADGSRVKLLMGGKEASFDYAILAVPFDALARMLPAGPESEPFRASLARFETSPITGIHLWFDRRVTDLDHAVLLDRTIQWMFHKSQLLAGGNLSRRSTDSPPEEPPSANGSYLELVVSASRSLIDRSKSEIVELALGELREFLPGVQGARLVKSTVIKEVHATYSPRPGADADRAPHRSLWPRVFLAGDWTDTGWPATMEGAVRSGYGAAEELRRAQGFDPGYLVPDLPPSGLMRCFGSPRLARGTQPRAQTQARGV